MLLLAAAALRRLRDYEEREGKRSKCKQKCRKAGHGRQPGFKDALDFMERF